jgi:NPCBM/NEW2 domain
VSRARISLGWALALLTFPSGAGLLTGFGVTCAASEPDLASDPVFKALLVDGSSASGRIVSFGPQAITLSGTAGATRALPLKGLIELSREAAVSLAPDRGHVLLPQGDCLMRVVIGAASDTSLEVQSDSLGKLSVPLDCLLGLILANPELTSHALDSFWDRLLVEPRATEVIWLQNGDRVAGGFLGLDERRIKIQIGGKPEEVERSAVMGVGFDPALVSYARPPTDFLDVTLKDGTRLGVTEVKLESGVVSAVTRFRESIRFPLGELVRVTARTSSIVYLSERTPLQASYDSYIGPTRPYRSDRTVDGHPLRLSGQVYDRGIGAQSRTLLAYRIEPGDRRFQAQVGVDDRAGPLGSVVFRVLLDKQERFRSPPLSARDAPRPIDLDLSGARFLILITEFGDRGSVRDLGDWVEARVIR